MLYRHTIRIPRHLSLEDADKYYNTQITYLINGRYGMPVNRLGAAKMVDPYTVVIFFQPKKQGYVNEELVKDADAYEELVDGANKEQLSQVESTGKQPGKQGAKKEELPEGPPNSDSSANTAKPARGKGVGKGASRKSK